MIQHRKPTGLYCTMKQMELHDNRSISCPLYIPGILITKTKKSLVRDKRGYSVNYQDLPSCVKCINSKRIKKEGEG